MKNGILKKNITLALSLLFLCGCNNTKQDYDCSISITIPSVNHTTIAPGRHFSVRGTIETEEPLPEDAVMTICLLDEEGNVVRKVQQDQKETSNFFIDYPGLEYGEEDDPNKEKLLAVCPPELLVEDLDNPYDSFYDATIKCYYDDEKFNAFFVSASEVGNGAVVDDQMHFTDENGNSYQAIEEGDYTIEVTLEDTDGTLIAQADQDIAIAPHENTIVARFEPIESRDLVFEWAEETGYEFCADIFPGNTDVIGIDAEIVPMWHAVDRAIFNEGCTNMLVYNITETSASYSVELGHLEKLGVVNDSSRFKAWYYDIGEPVFTVDDYQYTGKITEMEEGDKLVITRCDSVNSDTKDNYLDLVNSSILNSDMDESDGFTVSSDSIAFSGVVSPIQLEEEQFQEDEERNEFLINPGIQSIVYTVQNDDGTQSFTKEVGLTRNYEDYGEQHSLFEFYHVFNTQEILGSGTSAIVHVEAIDSYGNRIEGSEESFLVETK